MIHDTRKLANSQHATRLKIFSNLKSKGQFDVIKLEGNSIPFLFSIQQTIEIQRTLVLGHGRVNLDELTKKLKFKL